MSPMVLTMFVPFKAVPEGMRSRAPPPPEATLLQQTATWPGPPTDPPAEVKEMEVEGAKPSMDCTRTSGHRPNGEVLGEVSKIQVEVSQLEFFLAWSGR